MRVFFRLAGVATVLPGLLLPIAAQSQDYFIPNQNQRPNAPARPSPGTARPQPARPTTPPPAPQVDADAAPIQAPMPPVPELPPLPRVAPPPAPVVGIIGVPEVMRASVAAQQIDRVIGERRDKLNDEAQKEQQTWRDMQQALANQRSGLSPEQLRTKERELQDRITNAQRSFQARNRIIQEAAQYGLNQIQASLIGVIRQVAESHGMNLVVHRAQVALNVNELDLTEEVAEQLNRLLPSVTIPPDGISPNGTPAGAVAPVAAPKRP